MEGRFRKRTKSYARALERPKGGTSFELILDAQKLGSRHRTFLRRRYGEKMSAKVIWSWLTIAVVVGLIGCGKRAKPRPLTAEQAQDSSNLYQAVCDTGFLLEGYATVHGALPDANAFKRVIAYELKTNHIPDKVTLKWRPDEAMHLGKQKFFVDGDEGNGTLLTERFEVQLPLQSDPGVVVEEVDGKTLEKHLRPAPGNIARELADCMMGLKKIPGGGTARMIEHLESDYKADLLRYNKINPYVVALRGDYVKVLFKATGEEFVFKDVGNGPHALVSWQRDVRDHHVASLRAVH